jgi:hypothetical protein
LGRALTALERQQAIFLLAVAQVVAVLDRHMAAVAVAQEEPLGRDIREAPVVAVQ